MSDTKTAITASIVSVTSHYLMTQYSSGDRHFDNQVHTLTTMLLSCFMGYLFVFPYYIGLCISIYRYYSSNKNPYLIDGKISDITVEQFEKMENSFEIKNSFGMLSFFDYINNCSYTYTNESMPNYYYMDASEINIKYSIDSLKKQANSSVLCGNYYTSTYIANPVKIYRYSLTGYIYMKTVSYNNKNALQIRSTNTREHKNFINKIISHMENRYNQNLVGMDKNINVNVPKILYPYIYKGDRLIETVRYASETKRFENLFFKEKDKLIKVLNKFNNGNMYPKTISMENKLGILLYGPPGTGKTGTISAIAHYLQRDIVMIDLTVIKSREQLDAILKQNSLDFKKHIFVLEEIDIVLDVIKNRKNISHCESDDDESDKTVLTSDDNKKEKKKKKNDDYEFSTQIDLAYLLQLFDGVDSNLDRLVIMTTNYPDDIDEALLRPGRIDLKLKLGNCDHQMMLDIISRFYDTDEITMEQVKHIKQDVYSPSHIINSCISCDSYKDVLELFR